MGEEVASGGWGRGGALEDAYPAPEGSAANQKCRCTKRPARLVHGSMKQAAWRSLGEVGTWLAGPHVSCLI